MRMWGLGWLLALLVTAVGAKAKSRAWDWQKGTGDYSRFAAYEEQLRALAKQPFFSRVNGNVSVRLGETAYLPCRAKDLADSYMVTWMRVSDVTVLSVGALTFSSDPRFSVIHVPRPRIRADDWSLVITNTQARDSGRYECSVNTLPKISHTVQLSVEEMPMQDDPGLQTTRLPFTVGSRRVTMEDLALDLGPGPLSSISGPKVQYVSSGSTVGLECKISGLPSPPLSLYWKRGSRVLTAKERPGISLESEKVPGISTARLFISHVSTEDSATYSCISDLASPATVQLVVTQDHLGSALVSLSCSPSPLPSLLPAALTTTIPLLEERQQSAHCQREAGISLESEKVPGISTAKLFISHITTQDSATYSCISDLASLATVQLVVTQDHLGSALVSLSSASTPMPYLPTLLLIFFISSIRTLYMAK